MTEDNTTSPSDTITLSHLISFLPLPSFLAVSFPQQTQPPSRLKAARLIKRQCSNSKIMFVILHVTPFPLAASVFSPESHFLPGYVPLTGFHLCSFLRRDTSVFLSAVLLSRRGVRGSCALKMQGAHSDTCAHNLRHVYPERACDCFVITLIFTLSFSNFFLHTSSTRTLLFHTCIARHNAAHSLRRC